MVYSVVHGYRIPVKKDIDTSAEYRRILRQLRKDVDFDDVEKQAAQAAQKAAGRPRRRRRRDEPEDIESRYPPLTQDDGILRWGINEIKRHNGEWQPLKAADYEDQETNLAEEEPERVIFFDDIKDYLFPLSTPLQYALVVDFLEYLGVSIRFMQSRCSSSPYRLDRCQELETMHWATGSFSITESLVFHHRY